MRITGGTLRSRKLLSIESPNLRPATDRLRETMFNILANMIDLEGTTALDLYAGTGSVGFETLSRGAAKVVFVESDRRTAAIIARNAEALGVKERCDILIMTAERYVATAEEKFDIAYVDPPYKFNDRTHEVIDEMLRRNLLKKSGIICAEHSKKYVPPAPLLIRQKIFGSTILSFIKPESR